MRIKKNDKIKVIAGKDLGKEGKVIHVLKDLGKVVVEKINIVKKHTRPKKEGEKGQRVEIPSPIDVSNVMLVCPKCSKTTRVEYDIAEGGKNRVCKKCKKEM
jgi:large subunit ribosomal protein L24